MGDAGIVIIPLLIGVLEVLKKAGLIQGIFIGLSAVGLFSRTKNAFEK